MKPEVEVIDPVKFSDEIRKLNQMLISANTVAIDTRRMFHDMSQGHFQKYYWFLNRLTNKTAHPEDIHTVFKLVNQPFQNPTERTAFLLLTGLIHEFGLNCPINFKYAYACYSASIGKIHSHEAYAQMGYYFAKGLHCAPYLPSARSHLIIASHSGNAHAQFLLGDIDHDQTLITAAANANYPKALLYKASEAFHDRRYINMFELLTRAAPSGDVEIALFLSGLACVINNIPLSIESNAIAKELYHEEALSNESVLLRQFPNPDLSQKTLMFKIKTYLLYTNQFYPRKFHSNFSKWGYCAGLVQLLHLSRLRREERTFFSRYERICNWNGILDESIRIDMDKMISWINYLQMDKHSIQTSLLQYDLPKHESILVFQKEAQLSSTIHLFPISGAQSFVPFLSLLAGLKEISINNPQYINIRSTNNGVTQGHAVSFRYGGNCYHVWDPNDPNGRKIFSSFFSAASYLHTTLFNTFKNSINVIFTVVQFYTKEFENHQLPQKQKELNALHEVATQSHLTLGIQLRVQGNITPHFLAKIIFKTPALLNEVDQQGYSGLMNLLDHPECQLTVYALLNSPAVFTGIDLNHQTKDRVSVLSLAVEKSDSFVVESLIALGADINSANNRFLYLPPSPIRRAPLTLLETAIINNNLYTAAILLAYGHPVTATMINDAAKRNNSDILALLMSAHCPLDNGFKAAYQNSDPTIILKCQVYECNPKRHEESLYHEVLEILNTIQRQLGLALLQSQHTSSSSMYNDPFLSESKKTLRALRIAFSKNIATPQVILPAVTKLREKLIPPMVSRRNERFHF